MDNFFLSLTFRGSFHTLHKIWNFSLRICKFHVETVDLVTFTEEIVNKKLHFCAVIERILSGKKYRGIGLISEKMEVLHAELNERADAATSSYSVTGDFL